MVIGLPILLLISFLPGYLVLAPLRRAALEPRPPVQYRTMEILLLSVEIGALGVLMGSNFEWEHTIVFGVLAVVLGTWWLMGVRWLSHAGVTQASARMWILAVAVPLAFGIVPFLFTIFLSLAAMSTKGMTTFYLAGMEFVVTNEAAKTVFLVNQIVVVSLILGHVPLCRWMVRRALANGRDGGREVAA